MKYENMTAEIKQLRDILHSMLKLQDSFNRKLSPDWRTEGWAFHRAAWVECAELLGHLGWKWWSHREPDIDKAKMELVDIWHFLMSMMIIEGVGKHHSTLGDVASYWAPKIHDHMTRRRSSAGIIWLADRMVEHFAVGNFRVEESVKYFTLAVRYLSMSWSELHGLYVGKNVLNQFRQDRGYKQGEYIKVWTDGREDNEHMMELVVSLEADSTKVNFAGLLYDEIQQRWAVQQTED